MCVVPGVVQELGGDLQVAAGALKGALVPARLALERRKHITCINHVHTTVWRLIGEKVFKVGQSFDSVATKVPAHHLSM